MLFLQARALWEVFVSQLSRAEPSSFLRPEKRRGPSARNALGIRDTLDAVLLPLWSVDLCDAV